MDGEILYNEIRKIDNRPVSDTPVTGSLADLIKNSAGGSESPFTNVVYANITSDYPTYGYTQVISLTGKGKIKIILYSGSAQTLMKLTIDGNEVFNSAPASTGLPYNFNVLSYGTDFIENIGEFIFNSSIIVEFTNGSSGDSTYVGILYYIE